jgi:hypothetical protein
VILTVTFLVIAAVLALWIVGYLWLLGELKPPRWLATTLPAGAARARWQAYVRACRRAGTGSSWGRKVLRGAFMAAVPPGRPALPGRGSRCVDQQDWTPAHEGPRGYHVNAEPAPVMAAPAPARDLTRLATGTERRDAHHGYAHAPPFTDWLSDDTIARGMKAVQ